MEEKTRYTDEELAEFKALILEKLERAEQDYARLRTAMMNDHNDGSDTAPTFKVLEEGANTLRKEENAALAAHQLKFIQKLKAALVRIENKTYGICRITGKLIPAARLRAVPHATTTVDAKINEK
ncbi:MAG TPA: molecular chaperone DnaK [Bacteroidales bacterium]|nr:molecular chaperone DnaK [Bacteroidales bacterium]